MARNLEDNGGGIEVAFGSGHWRLEVNPVRALLTRLFGILEFHSHIRWYAVQRYVDFSADRTLEVGANTGVMTFEVAKRVSPGVVIASEYDGDLVALARQVQQGSGIQNVSFSQDDVRDLTQSEELFDQALVIDVLEHIDDHEKAVLHLAEAVRPGGRLVVSVPTPRYPRVFGEEYHESIGHVRDGYWADDMSALLRGAGFKVLAHHYYTGRLAAWVCGLYYRRGFGGKLAGLVMPLLIGVSLLGERGAMRDGVSLAMVAVRDR